MKRLIILILIPFVLVACSENETIEEKEMPKTRYIISFTEEVDMTELEKYGIESSDIINEMENMNMKTIDLNELQYERIKHAPFISHIEADEEIGVPPGETEDKSNEK